MKRATKRRIDLLLVEQGLALSRERAQAILLTGKVTANGQRVEKAGTMVDVNAKLIVPKPPPFVGRGGVKLDHALNEFNVDVAGLIALDVGASTGGFTDCLLKRGARKVYALDVGYGQLHHRIRTDQRVVPLERVNAHHPFDLPEKVDLATIDVSFISLTKVLPSVIEHLLPNSYLFVLVKPQFEAHRHEVGKGGVIRDPLIHAEILGRLISWLVSKEIRIKSLKPSTLLGDAGNREFFMQLQISN